MVLLLGLHSENGRRVINLLVRELLLVCSLKIAMKSMITNCWGQVRSSGYRSKTVVVSSGLISVGVAYRVPGIDREIIAVSDNGAMPAIHRVYVASRNGPLR